jgi:hypothetical protein
MVFSTVSLATAFDAGSLAAENFYTGQDRRALGARIKKLSRDAAAFEGELMATRLVGNSKIGASLMPLLTVGFDAVATDTVLGQKMSQLMAKRPLNLRRRNLKKLGIQNDHSITPHGQTSRSAEAGIPKDTHLKLPTPNRLQKLVCKILQQRIVAQAGLAPWQCYIIRRGAHAPHDRSSKIHDELFVFHAANAG